MAKLSNMLQKLDADTDGALIPVEVGQDVSLFKIPEADGRSVDELLEEAAPEFFQACLKTAHRAMTGQVNVFKDGDLPHKMALLLLHKMSPSRKWNAEPKSDTPEEVKRSARALKALIKSLSDDGEIVVDTTSQGIGDDDITKLKEVMTPGKQAKSEV